ncbi:patatin-like phospholipase family protein [Variovorax dokdonensis]|uniref:Patatin-like phospholipase family protein n=1 Tax=Variovorax dokdonensis TaxID=344883 RepID=A0ABT7N8E9_9BURK|nr:patatin-like phospholipase family protein [Variovorax dokdonensis]MDM0044155.1 patatin-like phospholipase family protein [Variovorax dokdonensis]
MATRSARPSPSTRLRPGKAGAEKAAPEAPAIGRKTSRSRTTDKRRVAIACQGGGSQTAFTAGVLKGLFEAGAHEEFDIVSLSGTSGGAICATLAWYALAKGDAKPWERLYAFWQDNMACTPAERALNQVTLQALRLTGQGWLPMYNTSPSSPLIQQAMSTLARGMRPLYTDFRGLLEKHIDFAELAAWGPRPNGPALLMGAVDTLSGRLAKFCSRIEAIRVEHILSSCAVPSIFPAVEFDGGAYWDGLFSDNPPLNELAQARFVGPTSIAQEIWVIKINPTQAAQVPVTPDQIGDRRNELIGNVSLFQQLDALAVMNELYLQGAFAPQFAKRFDLDGPIRVPKCFCDDEDRSYHIPFIEMSDALASKLDYESKLDRSQEHIEALMLDGEQQAGEFLLQRAAMVSA